MGEQLSESDIDAIMALADTDGDGSIDMAEFVQVGKMSNELEAMSRTMIAELDALSMRLDEEVVEMTSSMAGSVASVDARSQLAMESIVQHYNFYSSFSLKNGTQFLNCHLETTIANDCNHLSIRYA